MAELVCAECGNPGSVMMWVGGEDDGFYSCSLCWREATTKLARKPDKEKKKDKKKRATPDDTDPLL